MTIKMGWNDVQWKHVKTRYILRMLFAACSALLEGQESFSNGES